MPVLNTPEGKVKRAGRAICKEVGVYHFPVQQGGTSNAGIPDDVVCAWGLFLQIEYKHHMVWDKRTVTAYRSLPSDRQVWMMEKCRRGLGVTWVIDDTNLHLLEPSLRDIEAVAGEPVATIWQAAMNAPGVWDWSYADFAMYKKGIGSVERCIGRSIPVYVKGM